VLGSLWPAARCTSSSVAPFSSAVVMKVARVESDLVILATNVMVIGNRDCTDFPNTCCGGLFCNRDHLHKIENRSAGELQALDQLVLKFLNLAVLNLR
jgi:hypothetical protein